MPDNSLYPLKLQAALHVKVWGGRKLAERLHKVLPTDEPYGESWELHDSARALNGEQRGRSLAELTRAFGADLIGAANDPAEGFPLLAKFIDASDWLSVQVHPNDAQARALEGEARGKTEAWIVLQADPAARLVAGIRSGTSRSELKASIQQSTLERLLEFTDVRSGDVLTVPANTVHALGPGILIYEIQQASDVTYRLYDWGRLGLDGQPRQLHIDKGLRVASLAEAPEVRQPGNDLLVDGEYFQTWRHALSDGEIHLQTEGHFQALTCIAGIARAQAKGHPPISLSVGETGLIPASIDAFRLSGSGVILRSRQP